MGQRSGCTKPSRAAQGLSANDYDGQLKFPVEWGVKHAVCHCCLRTLPRMCLTAHLAAFYPLFRCGNCPALSAGGWTLGAKKKKYECAGRLRARTRQSRTTRMLAVLPTLGLAGAMGVAVLPTLGLAGAVCLTVLPTLGLAGIVCLAVLPTLGLAGALGALTVGRSAYYG